MTKLCKESHLRKINKKMGNVVLAQRSKQVTTGWTKCITAGASSSGTLNTGSHSDTLNDPLSFMGGQEGQVRTVHAGESGGDRDKKPFQHQF